MSRWGTLFESCAHAYFTLGDFTPVQFWEQSSFIWFGFPTPPNWKKLKLFSGFSSNLGQVLCTGNLKIFHNFDYTLMELFG